MTTREKLIEAKRQRDAGELANARRLELEAMDELLERGYAEIENPLLQAGNLNHYAAAVHAANEKWWQDPTTGLPIKRNRGELLALVHSEVSEALEGERKNLMDDKLPQYPMAQVECVDAIIRLLDYLAGIHPGCDIQKIYEDKMEFNAIRADHKHEARLIAGGKQF